MREEEEDMTAYLGGVRRWGGVLVMMVLSSRTVLQDCNWGYFSRYRLGCPQPLAQWCTDGFKRVSKAF